MAVGRLDFWRRMGVIQDGPNVDAYTERAYEAWEERLWREGLDNSPHGHPWHTSFHASEFPYHERSCGRKALYGLMNIPSLTPIGPYGRAIMDAGKDLERQIVMRWERAGWLLSAAPDSRYQTGFEDPETWLTCSVDAILDLRPNWSAVVPVDVKSKDDNVINEMKMGARTFDEAHKAQVMTQVYFCRKEHEALFAPLGLEICRGGVVYYVSRGRPRNTKEFYFEWDPAYFEAGLDRLAAWRRSWEAGELPERPRDWRWTEHPCDWCEVKPLCKQDLRDGVTSLEESAVISHARTISPSYDYSRARLSVMDRWRKGAEANA